ncbi:cytochrome P450 [Sphaerulina musiva SO2202]|uniref:Cytochrome P450 n=1 Tax=Sphaerulina musiva (strain SO2202) TaxID=692275 RepID=M3D0D3_SPHMS|nr:cytochrome P450 [Sphaerulina musiva SO2202]EMF09938.1 cytochrome P450 [Sphaerulina musiva SO2202]
MSTFILPASGGLSKKDNVWTLAVALGILYSTYSVLARFYSVYFGPLSHIPGPKLRAFTRIPDVIAIIRGTKDRELVKLHGKYGVAVRIRPREVSYAATPEVWKELNGFKSVTLKDPSHYFDQNVNHTRSVFDALDRTEHSRQRKVLSHSFADKTLREIEPLLQGWARKFGERLVKSASAPVDMATLYHCLTFDVMADICFAEDLGMLASGKLNEWVHLIFANVATGAVINCIKNLHPILEYIVTYIYQHGPVKAKRIVHWNFTKDRMDRRTELDNPSRQDLWSAIIKSSGRPGGLTLDEQHSNASVFMIAGTETTSSALAGTTYLLLKNPKYLKILTQEIRENFNSLHDLRLDALARLKNLNAILQESLRIYPPAPGQLPRITPKEGCNLLDTFVPGNTVVAIHQLAGYQLPQNFKDPMAFRPERWLGDPEFKDDRLGAAEPFGTGPRNCIGKNLAWHEMRLVLSSVLLQFDLELCPESDGWFDTQKIYLLWGKPPLMCKLTRVNPSA